MTEIEERNRRLADANRDLLLKIDVMRSAGDALESALVNGYSDKLIESLIEIWREASK